MSHSLKILAATFMALAQSATAIAPVHATSDALSKLAPFRPTSLVNEDPAVCDPFLAGWTKAFDGSGKLDESAMDFSALYTQAQVFVVPELPDWRNYSERSSYSIAVDFDGDGENEVLEFRSQYLGWRYMSVSLSLFDSEADFARANEPNRPPPRQIYEYAPINRARILKIGAKLYTLRGPYAFERPRGLHESTAADVVVSLVQTQRDERAAHSVHG
ncbi:MAG: hypothetical protein IT548_09865 [Alphaproteobacteria bacterium]|nr:hypothetical protein [Alphaproteobacteria bacterium]